MARILLIDDSLTERTIIAAWLQKSGHSVLEAENAETGLALTVQQKPDLVLMDVIMPGKNGFEATRAIRRDPLTSKIPVIIISSKSQPSDLAWGKRQGATDYLAKPFSAALLQQAVDRALSSEGP